VRLLEWESKSLLTAAGVPVPAGEHVTDPAAAEAVARRLGRPVILKAQIPASNRHAKGGIRKADNPTDAGAAAAALLALRIDGWPVESLLVEEAVNVQTELFIGFTYDNAAKSAAMLLSRRGGSGVERRADSVHRRYFSVRDGFPAYLGREIAAAAGMRGKTLLRVGGLTAALGKLFLQLDATLLETNPLALLANGDLVVLDVHLQLDDDALFRHNDLVERFQLADRSQRPRSDFEREAAAIDAVDHRGVAGRLIPFDGDLGLLIGGGGASLTAFDAILAAGGRPANYCEIGGNPSVWKVKELTKLILRQPGVDKIAVIMNVVSNTRADLIARGVIKGVIEAGLTPEKHIVAFRVPGAWEAESRAILQRYGVPAFGRETSIDQVVQHIVEAER